MPRRVRAQVLGVRVLIQVMIVGAVRCRLSEFGGEGREGCTVVVCGLGLGIREGIASSGPFRRTVSEYSVGIMVCTGFLAQHLLEFK